MLLQIKAKIVLCRLKGMINKVTEVANVIIIIIRPYHSIRPTATESIWIVQFGVLPVKAYKL